MTSSWTAVFAPWRFLPALAVFLAPTVAWGQAEFRINCGGDVPADFTDSNGNLFVADRPFVAGSFGFVGGTAHGPLSGITGTPDTPLYATLRADPSFGYVFDGLPAGDYDVTLYLIEPAGVGSLGTFDLTVEGQLVLDDFSALAASGANRLAFQETFTTTVSDGALTMDFLASTGLAHVSAIAVVPAGTPPPTTTYVEVGGAVGLVLFHDLAPICTPPLGSGSAWADYDNDGDLDLFVTNHGGANHLYRNDGDLNSDGLPDFAEVAAQAGVDDPTGVGHSSVFIDYDNDGDQDLYVTNWGGNNLYENQLVETGSAVFVDVTPVAGIADFGRCITSAWGDFDRDGFLDLYLAKHRYCSDDDQSQDHLFHNLGNGTFQDVTNYLCGGPSCPQVLGLGFAPGWLDYDNDGDPDLYLVNDNIDSAYHENVLWRNDGPDGLGGWMFTDVSVAAGVDISLNGMGLGIGDYDNDGLLDLAFSNVGANYLMHNLGDDGFGNVTFQDVALAVGTQRATLNGNTSVTWGTVFFDHDNDGWLDLMIVAGNTFPGSNGGQPAGQANAFFRNNGDGTFSDAAASSGLNDGLQGRSASIGDFDGDGFMDVFVGNYGDTPRLFHNEGLPQGNSNNWLVVDPEGVLSNRDGIGARLTLTTPDSVTQIREITSGSTHGGGDQKIAHFGLGSNATGDLTISWPSGIFDDLGTVAANQVLRPLEGSGLANRPPTGLSLTPSSVGEGQPVGTTVGTFMTVDPDPSDTHTYALVAGAGDTDNGLFAVAGDTLQTAAVLDISVQGSPLSVRVETDDGNGGTFQGQLLITVTPANSPPTGISLAPSSVVEGQPVGTTVGTFTTVDPDPSDTHTYALVAGAGDTDNGLFSVVGDTLQTAAVLDLAVQGSPLSVRVVTDDGNGGTFQDQLLITVTPAPAIALRINCGGDVPMDFVDSNGDLFVADRAFVAGSFGFVGGTAHGPLSGITGTPDTALYAALRADPSFGYVFDGLPAGDYDVTLYLIEPAGAGSLGTFDLTVEGQLVLDDFNALAVSGANRTAFQQSFTVTVSDGALTMDFLASTGLAHVSAIAVVGQ